MTEMDNSTGTGTSRITRHQLLRRTAAISGMVAAPCIIPCPLEKPELALHCQQLGSQHCLGAEDGPKESQTISNHFTGTHKKMI